jgi:hypothetical protein
MCKKTLLTCSCNLHKLWIVPSKNLIIIENQYIYNYVYVYKWRLCLITKWYFYVFIPFQIAIAVGLLHVVQPVNLR